MSAVSAVSAVTPVPHPAPTRSLLVVELLGGFGDLLLALPAVHALAATHPGAEVTVLTFAPGAVLLAHDPAVHRVVATDDHADGAPRRAVAAELARGHDLVVTTTTYDGIADLCRAAGGRAVADLWRGAPPDQRVDRRFLQLLVEAGEVAPTHADQPLRVVLTDAERAAARALPTGDAPVVLVPGSGMPVKTWPRWAELVAALGDRDVLSTEPVPGARPLPPGDLRHLAALLAVVGERGGVVVGGDTGPVRLATAVGTRAVALHGPTAASRYGLDPRRGRALQGLPDCTVRQPSAITEQECWWSARCPLTGAAPACMADLGVEQVLAALAPA